MRMGFFAICTVDWINILKTEFCKLSGSSCEPRPQKKKIFFLYIFLHISDILNVFHQSGMWTGGDSVSLRGQSAIAASSSEYTSCRASQRQQCSHHRRGFGAPWWCWTALQRPPLGILLICIYRFMLSLPPKHHIWHSGVMVWQEYTRLLQIFV